MVILIMNQKRKFIIDSDNDKKEKYNGNIKKNIVVIVI